jgi:predicted nucleic acid-binding protein
LAADPSLPETSFTIVPAFVDANILVYAEDQDAGRKHIIARDLVASLWRSGEGVLSVQVLQEFFVIVTRKIPRPLNPEEAFAIVEQYLEVCFSPGFDWHQPSRSRSGMRW